MRTRRIGLAAVAALVVVTTSCVRSNEGALVVSKPLPAEDPSSAAPESSSGEPEAATPDAATSDAPDAGTTAQVSTPPFTEQQPGCLAEVEALPEPPAAATTGDLLAAAWDGALVPLPVPGTGAPVVDAAAEATTLDQFFAQRTGIVEPVERRAALQEAGLVRSVALSFSDGDNAYDLTAIRFASVDGARAYYDLHLRRLCADAVQLRPLEHPVGGVAYFRLSHGDATPIALALVGDVEVSVSICRCVGADDLAQVAADWLSAVVDQMNGSGPVT